MEETASYPDRNACPGGAEPKRPDVESRRTLLMASHRTGGRLMPACLSRGRGPITQAVDGSPVVAASVLVNGPDGFRRFR